jgi:hypothetical protein
MVDLSKFVAANSDQLNAEDLIAGPRVITITRVTGRDSAEQPVEVHFEGDDGRPWRPCKTMRRALIRIWGADTSTYAGRQLKLFRDPTVQYGGLQVGGIRIEAASHIDRPVQMALPASKKRVQAITIQPLSAPGASSPAMVPKQTAGEGAAPAAEEEPPHQVAVDRLQKAIKEAADAADLAAIRAMRDDWQAVKSGDRQMYEALAAAAADAVQRISSVEEADDDQ